MTLDYPDHLRSRLISLSKPFRHLLSAQMVGFVVLAFVYITSPYLQAGKHSAKKPPSLSQEYLELIIPLRDGKTFSLLDYCKACNRVLKTTYPWERLKDRIITISPEEQNVLRLADLAGLVQIRFETSRVIMRLPNPENEVVRQEKRRYLERMLGIQLTDWPAGSGLGLPKKFDPAARSFLFIHGLASSSPTFADLSQKAKGSGFQVLTFDYPNDGPIRDSGQRLAEELSRLSQRHPRFQVVIVAHSMGGLVARYALEVVQSRPACVSDLFTLGTPHGGSRLAKYQPLLEFFEGLAAPGDRPGLLRQGLGEAGLDLLPGSEFLKELQAAKRSTTVRYHVIAGSQGLFPREEVPALKAQCQAFLRRQMLPEEEEQRILAFLGDLDEIVTGKGDGAVALASAKLPGCASERVFSLTHSELLQAGDQAGIFPHIVTTLGWDKKKVTK